MVKKKIYARRPKRTKKYYKKRYSNKSKKQRGGSQAQIDQAVAASLRTAETERERNVERLLRENEMLRIRVAECESEKMQLLEVLEQLGRERPQTGHLPHQQQPEAPLPPRRPRPQPEPEPEPLAGSIRILDLGGS